MFFFLNIVNNTLFIIKVMCCEYNSATETPEGNNDKSIIPFHLSLAFTDTQRKMCTN